MVGAVLLVTAVFTIGSVIRLTFYLYQDEIAVMRMVGATEFFIRGPFVTEGFLHGLAGGFCALGGLFTAQRLLLHYTGDGLLTTMLAEQFLSPSLQLGLVLVGAGAGILGAVLSLRKERVPADGSDGWAAARSGNG